MKVDQYCQRQRCKHVELEQFLACFRVAQVCQRRLGFLVLTCIVMTKKRKKNIESVIQVFTLLHFEIAKVTLSLQNNFTRHVIYITVDTKLKP